MLGHLTYGQHPVGAVPLGFWPTYARVGNLAVIGGPSSAARQPYRVWPQDERVRKILADDKDFMEIIQMAIQAGLLD